MKARGRSGGEDRLFLIVSAAHPYGIFARSSLGGKLREVRFSRRQDGLRDSGWRRNFGKSAKPPRAETNDARNLLQPVRAAREKAIDDVRQVRNEQALLCM